MFQKHFISPLLIDIFEITFKKTIWFIFCWKFYYINFCNVTLNFHCLSVFFWRIGSLKEKNLHGVWNFKAFHLFWARLLYSLCWSDLVLDSSDGEERRYSPLFCLNLSSCFRQKTGSHQVIERGVDPELPSDDYFEPVAPEYQGKEAIR